MALAYVGTCVISGSPVYAGGVHACIFISGKSKPTAALFEDGSFDASSAALSGSLSVQGEAKHYGGLTLMPPPRDAVSTLSAPAGVVSASSVRPAGRKLSLLRVGPQSGFSADDDGSAGECARQLVCCDR